MNRSARPVVFRSARILAVAARFAAFVAVPVALGGARSAAQTLELVGRLDAEITAFDVRDDVAYVVQGPTLRVLDWNDPARPRQVGMANLPDFGRQVAVENGVAFVVAGLPAEPDRAIRLLFFDVADPTRPTFRGAYESASAPVRDIFPVGSRLHLADSEGLKTIDASDPSAPFVLAAVAAGRDPRAVAFEGNTICVADAMDGLFVFDATQPSAPRLAGADPAPVGEVALLDSVAYTLSPLQGITELRSLRVAGGGAPVLLDSLEAVGDRIEVAGESLHVLSRYPSYSGISIVDASDPEDLGFRTHLAIWGTAGHAADGTNLYAMEAVVDYSTAARLHRYDASDPAAPAYAGAYYAPSSADIGSGRVERFVDGSRVYLPGSVGNLGIADVSDPTRPAMLATYSEETAFANNVPVAQAYDVEVLGDIAYLGSGDGVRVLDLSEPTSPTLLANLDLGYRMDMAADRGYFYTPPPYPGAGRNLVVADLSIPEAPMLVGSYPSAPLAMALAGSTAYLAGGTAGVEVVDFSLPDMPATLSSIPETAFYVAASGSRAYLLLPQLRVVDASDPASPRVTARREVHGFAVAGDERFVFVGTGTGVAAFDAGNPDAILPVAEIEVEHTPDGYYVDWLHLQGDFLYAAGPGGLHIFRFDAPAETPSPTPSASPTISPSPTSSPSPSASPSPTPSVTPTLTPAPSASPTPPPTPRPGALSNLSTRGQVGRVDSGEAMIGGFIVAGGGARRMLVTGVGPDLGSFGVEGFLGDPALAIFDGQTILGVNNDWMESADAGTILATGFAPNDPRESAVLLDLAPGAYTALLAGAAFGTGVGLVQAFDLGPAPGAADDSRPVNLSTRVLVGADERATIAGFTIEGEAQARVLVRALGPTIGAEPFSVPGTLADPEVRVFTAPASGEPVELAYNDDWSSPSVPAQSIEELGFAPDSEREATVLLHLGAGAYTAVVSGVGPDEAARSGVALVEIYEIAP